MLFKLHLILAFHAKIICNFSDISYLSKMQKNNFQFLNEIMLYISSQIPARMCAVGT